MHVAELSAAVLLAAGAASAQAPVFSAEPTESCLAAADAAGREACVGRSAGACMESPGGASTVGMSGCLAAEADFWDGRLNAAYKALTRAEKAFDVESRVPGLTVPSAEQALRDMQRAWIAYRDASCAYEASQWGGGTGGGPASEECIMRMTGEQALALEARLAEKRAQ